jgi:hypothetical protein
VRVGKRTKLVYVGLFADEQACADACAAKRAEVEAAIAKKLHAMAQELEHTRGLPLRPKHAADAEPETAYYGEKGYGVRGEPKAFGPTRLVRSACKSKPGGFALLPCCRTFLESGAPCTSLAARDRKHCNLHGGGFKVGEARGNSFCTHCKTTHLREKRRPQHGGNGLCPTCETHLKTEAAANGHDGPTKSQRWEDVVFDQLLPLITYADGKTPFPPDQRDERRGGGLGTSVNVRKRRRECETTTNRFPDALWVLRDERGRAVMALAVEVDEHSHGDREPKCESGKIDDTFQALQDKLAKEGAARGAVARHDAQMLPIVTIRVNPNAYDKKIVKLPERVKAVAAVVRAYLQMDAETREALQTHAPIVHVLYYHTKEGARNLAHYAAKAAEAGWQCTVHAP